MNDLKVHLSSVILFVVLLSGCSSTPVIQNNTNLKKYKPRSIVIIPPKNNSLEVNAPYIYLSTLTRPLAEKGYYVFPVYVIDSFLKANGLSSPAEMHNVSLNKIGEHIGADAVLYISIEQWGQKFKVLSSVTQLRAILRLVDVKTGKDLWSGNAVYNESSSPMRSSLSDALVNSIVTQIIASSSESVMLNASIKANHRVINSTNTGLLKGPYKK